MGRLAGTRFYCCGAMDRAPDGGVGWREKIIPTLNQMGIAVINPADKPINIGKEDIELRQIRRDAKLRGDWAAVEADKIVRTVDLRCVDISDALIVSLDMAHKPFGTIEEIVLGNRQKKPVIVEAVGGKADAPDWLFWMISERFIFDTMDEIMEYLLKIDSGELDDKRWVHFDFKKMYRNTNFNEFLS